MGAQLATAPDRTALTPRRPRHHAPGRSALTPRRLRHDSATASPTTPNAAATPKPRRSPETGTAPVVRRWRGAAAVRHWAGPLRSGTLRVLLAATVLVGFAVGASTVAVTNYAEVAGAPSESGWLLAAQAFGALLGGITFTRRQPRDLPRRLPVIVLLLYGGDKRTQQADIAQAIRYWKDYKRRMAKP